MSHSPTPPTCEPGRPRTVSTALTELHTLLSGVALPKSKNAKSVTVPLATFRTILDLTTAATKAVEHEPEPPLAGIATLAAKLDALTEQVAQNSYQQACTYAQAAASEGTKPAHGAPPPKVPHSVTPAPERSSRFDFILRQLDYKHPVLANDTPADIQRTINDIIIQSDLHCGNDATPVPERVFPCVRAVAKLRNGNIRLFWRDQEERDTARMCADDWLPRLSPKLEVLWPSYRVVVHGAPTSLMFDTDIRREEAARTIIRENSFLSSYSTRATDTIPNIQWLSRRPPACKSHSSLVLFFECAEDANHAIEHGIAINGRLLRAERFRAYPTQCFNCYRFGHIARYCRGRSTCGLCAGPHATNSCRCPSENACIDMTQCKHTCPKCALCKGPHSALSRDCPVRADIFARCNFGHQQFGAYYYAPPAA